MRISLRQILVTVIVGLTLASCRQNEVDGIFIDHTLYENQSLEKNRELIQLIRQTLNKDDKALAKLNDFWCGGGAGCYDLGFIVTQIILDLAKKILLKWLLNLTVRRQTDLKA